LADALNSPIVPSKPKHSLLPVLVVLFLISYGLLTRLVVEQDRVITFQLTLIKQLLGDSRELAALKGKMQLEQKQNHSHAQAPAQRSQAAPDSQHSQTQERNRQRNNRETRRPKAMPEHPPIPASDAMDERRAQVKI
jgi:hypothetical protein